MSKKLTGIEKCVKLIKAGIIGDSPDDVRRTQEVIDEILDMSKKSVENKPNNSLQVNVYNVLARAIEEGLDAGWRRAHKHTSTPGEDVITGAQYQAIMNELCEVFTFDFGEDE